MIEMETKTKMSSQCHLLEKLPTTMTKQAPSHWGTHSNYDCPQIHKDHIKQPIGKIKKTRLGFYWSENDY